MKSLGPKKWDDLETAGTYSLDSEPTCEADHSLQLFTLFGRWPTWHWCPSVFKSPSFQEDQMYQTFRVHGVECRMKWAHMYVNISIIYIYILYTYNLWMQECMCMCICVFIYIHTYIHTYLKPKRSIRPPGFFDFWDLQVWSSKLDKGRNSVLLFHLMSFHGINFDISRGFFWVSEKSELVVWIPLGSPKMKGIGILRGTPIRIPKLTT